MKNSKYRVRILLVFLAALLLLGLAISFLRPLHYREKVSVCTLEGETLEVELDVTLRRHLWGSVRSHGKIVVDGVEYINMNDLYSKDTLKKQAGSHIFLIPSPYALDTWNNDRIYLEPVEDRFNQFLLSFVKSGEMTTFFGPAASQEEAWEVAEAWMH